eukprot:TRINITY_DN138_c0_g1_i1.p1 TRINITY_DN138_c0_g1~~TRINITY_DN138_c0_g1_i1.p1  ORF type:complete len:435 (+),score=120.49 TRINITY_DN138_c0_g1_i1:152-1456(+)
MDRKRRGEPLSLGNNWKEKKPRLQEKEEKPIGSPMVNQFTPSWNNHQNSWVRPREWKPFRQNTEINRYHKEEPDVEEEQEEEEEKIVTPEKSEPLRPLERLRSLEDEEPFDFFSRPSRFGEVKYRGPTYDDIFEREEEEEEEEEEEDEVEEEREVHYVESSSDEEPEPFGRQILFESKPRFGLYPGVDMPRFRNRSEPFSFNAEREVKPERKEPQQRFPEQISVSELISNEDDTVAKQMREDEIMAQRLQDQFNTRSTPPDEYLARQYQAMENRRSRHIPFQEPNLRGGNPFLNFFSSYFTPPTQDMSNRRALINHLLAERFSGAPRNGHTNRDLLRLSLMNRDFNENDYEMLLQLDETVQKKGASQDDLDTIPSFQATENMGSCVICLSDMEEEEWIRKLSCSHCFHLDCIDQWLKVNKCCPIDKREVNNDEL